MAEALHETIQTTLIESLDRPFSAVRDELAHRLTRDLTQAAGSARGAAIESLNVAIRRIRRASDITEIGVSLLETASAYAGRTALFVHKRETLTGWKAHGFDASAWTNFQINLRDAPAMAQALETREAVVSLSLPDHLSGALVNLLELGPNQKVYLFPLCLRNAVVALVYADGAGSEDGVQAAAVELLCAVAEASIEALASRPPAREQPGDLDRILTSAARSAAKPAPTDWNEMSPSQREMHLRAQRFARVLVADMQLYRAAEIREGKRVRNIYSRLKEEIDKSREVYDRKFGQSEAAGMDYFHVELVRTLAEDQEDLLGPDYPGPMMAFAVG